MNEKEDEIDIEAMKRAVEKNCAREERGGKSQVPHRKYGYFPSNRQPPKKKRKKK